MEKVYAALASRAPGITTARTESEIRRAPETASTWSIH